MTIRVAILAFDGIIPFHLSVPFAVFETAKDAAGRPAYDIAICAATPGLLRTSMGFSIQVDRDLDFAREAEVLIVPSWSDPHVSPSPALRDVLLDAAGRGAQVIGLCMGAFVLAAIGLLDGRPATTHWQWIEPFRRLYPQVRLNPDVLYLHSENIVTSAGTSASIDCCLWLVRNQLGAEAANSVARQLVTPPFREGGQAQYIEQPVYNSRSGDRFLATLAWATENLTEPLSVECLALHAELSRRSFTRRFNAVTGTTLRQWLLNQRLALAQRFLESSDMQIEMVAQKSGFSSAMLLRRYFRQRLQTTPLAYRKTFRREGEY